MSTGDKADGLGQVDLHHRHEALHVGLLVDLHLDVAGLHLRPARRAPGRSRPAAPCPGGTPAVAQHAAPRRHARSRCRNRRWFRDGRADRRRHGRHDGKIGAGVDLLVGDLAVRIGRDLSRRGSSSRRRARVPTSSGPGPRRRPACGSGPSAGKLADCALARPIAGRHEALADEGLPRIARSAFQIVHVGRDDDDRRHRARA